MMVYSNYWNTMKVQLSDHSLLILKEVRKLKIRQLHGGTEEKPENPHSGQMDSGPIFQPKTRPNTMQEYRPLPI